MLEVEENQGKPSFNLFRGKSGFIDIVEKIHIFLKYMCRGKSGLYIIVGKLQCHA